MLVKYLEVGDGVKSWQPGGAWVLLRAERPIERSCDGTKVVRTNCWGGYTVPILVIEKHIESEIEHIKNKKQVLTS